MIRLSTAFPLGFSRYLVRADLKIVRGSGEARDLCVAIVWSTNGTSRSARGDLGLWGTGSGKAAASESGGGGDGGLWPYESLSAGAPERQVQGHLWAETEDWGQRQRLLGGMDLIN